MWDFEHLAESPLASVGTLFYLGFMIWMLIDVSRRGVEPFWFWIIVFVPFGPWIYFFVHVVPGGIRLPRVGSAAPLWQRKLSLDELRYRAERGPTVVNRLALAERLMEKGEHAEAIPLLEAILQVDHAYCPAMHNLAVCHIACGAPEKAVPVLNRLIDRDRRWSDYRAWRTLIDAYDAQEQPEPALEACRQLEKMMPTLENKCQLAQRLIDTGRRQEAASLLDQALEDLHYAPFSSRMRNWRWAREARRLLKEAEAA